VAEQLAIRPLPSYGRFVQRRVKRMGLDERRGFALGIDAVTAPAIMRRVLDHRRAHWIQFDVAMTLQKIAFLLQ